MGGGTALYINQLTKYHINYTVMDSDRLANIIHEFVDTWLLYYGKIALIKQLYNIYLIETIKAVQPFD